MRWRNFACALACLAGLSACGGNSASDGTSDSGSADTTTTGGVGGGSGDTDGSSSTGGAATSSDSATNGANSSNSSNSSSSGGTGTGGTASGGSSSGGGPAGGASTGGAGGGAGGTGNDGGAGAPSGGECVTADDCELFQDCCSCRAVPAGSAQVSCRAACDQPACDAQGIGEADVACLGGSCVINRSCDDRNVLCDVATPECPEGTVPEVADACYTGNCREAGQCTRVSSCAVCLASDLLCVTYSAWSVEYRCIAPRDDCDPKDCACLDACGDAGFQCAEEGLECYCPLC